MTGRDPEGIRRAIIRGELEEVTGDDGVKGITYASLTRFAAARGVKGFFLTAGVLNDSSLDDIAPSFWAVISATLSRTAVLRQLRADAHALAGSGNETDARLALDWAALAEFAEIIPPSDGNGTWRVHLPAAGITLPLSAGIVADARDSVAPVVASPRRQNHAIR
jgi:hypothetical protein